MNACKLPPEGWACTREAGHDGPCAAVFKPELPRTEFEKAMFNAETRRLADAVQRAALPSTLGLLGKYAWTLKCLTEDVRGLSKMLEGEHRANATLALRHLEDAHHRMTLAQSSNSNT